MEAPNPLPLDPQPPAPVWRWLRALALLGAGVVLGLAFAAYGGTDLLLNFSNLRYCG